MDVFGKEYDLRKAVVRRCSVKKVFLEISQNSQENTCARVYFLIKFQASACNFINKETLEQVFSCEFCEISKNPFSYRTSKVAASENGIKHKKATKTECFSCSINTMLE